MKLASLFALAISCVGTTLGYNTILSQAQASEDVHFICAASFDQQTHQHFPTTYAVTLQKKTAVIWWKFPWFNNAEYNPQRRCQEVSARFQTAYNNGSLRFITNSTSNRQPVICTSRNNGGACDTTLLTLRPSDDPLQILTTLKDLLNGRATEPLEHSSGKHQVYYQIDINKFLQTAPLEPE